MEAGLPPAAPGRAPWRWWARASSTRRFDPNRFILNELSVVGSFVYDQGGFETALGAAWRRAASPPTCSSRPTTCPSTASSDALAGLAEGRLAGKVMVVPRGVGRGSG